MTDTTNNDNAKPDGQAVRLTRDVMPMADVLAELRSRTVREQNKHFANMIEFEQSNPPHLGLLWHLSQTSLQMATKFAGWLDELEGKTKSTQHEDRKSSPTPSA